MSSSSSTMDYQKPVKVKSRWTQSCQMEMMMEESQSSLDMSDTITDVSTSDLNDVTDDGSELNAIELRRSRRISSSKTDYKQLNGLKTNRKKKCIIFKTSKKRGRKKKELLNTTENGNEDNMQKSNIIIHPSVDWNCVQNFQSKVHSKSVNNINEIIDNCSSKPKIRRASLSWGFKFTNEVEDNSSILEKYSFCNFSNELKQLNLNDTLLKITSIDNQQLCDKKLDKEANIANDHMSTQAYLYVDVNCKHSDEKCNEVSNINEIEVSQANLNKQKQLDELNEHMNQLDENNTFQSNNVLVHKPLSPELKNIQYSPKNSQKKIRSKSLEVFKVKTATILKRSKSYDDMNKLKYPVDALKLKKLQIRSPKKNRRQSKRIKPNKKNLEILDDMKVPEINYDQVADKVYREHKNQLLEARINDKEFDQKLKTTNFTLVNENVYRPNR